MNSTTLLLVLLALVAFGYFFGRNRSLAAVHSRGGHRRDLHSLPEYYGYMAALWAGLPALLLLLAWSALEPTTLNHLLVAHFPDVYQGMSSNDIGLALNSLHLEAGQGNPADIADPAQRQQVAYLLHLQETSRLLKTALVVVLSLAGLAWAVSRISPRFRARNAVERIIRYILIAASSVAILTTVGIVLSVLFESLRFFAKVPITEFLFGLEWSPQIAIRAGQVGSDGAFGIIPLFVGTLLIALIALALAVPIGLMTAIYLSEYASPRFRAIAKPTLEVLAGIPTVVYGFFAALTVAPAIRAFGESLGLEVSSESALAAGIVMGVMIIPFMSSLSEDVISAVPRAMRDGSLGMGATRSETIRLVLLPAALPGIVGGILLAASRAIGETMIVVMAAGLTANLTLNPLEAVTTVTVQIVTLLTGDQEFDSAKTLAAFALALMLFITTLILNVIALHVVRRYREQYE